MIIGNKSDDEKRRKVTHEEIRKLSQETGIMIIETSAKIGSKVEEAFKILGKKILSSKTGRNRNEYNGVRLESKPLQVCEACC